jgi:regulator of RNase E activity RraB
MTEETVESSLNKYGAQVINYLLESDRSYITASEMSEDLDLNPYQTGLVLSGLAEKYDVEIDQWGTPTNWYLDPLREQDLESLREEVLEK